MIHSKQANQRQQVIQLTNTAKGTSRWSPGATIKGDAHLPKWQAGRPSGEASQPTLEPVRSPLPRMHF